MKPILLLAVISIAPHWAFAQDPGQVSGTVTYYFNEFRGDQPDIGAKVYILDSASAGNFSIDLADSFYYAAFYLGVKQHYLDMNEPVPDNIQEGIDKSGASDQKVFDSMDQRCAAQVLDFINNADTHSVLTNDLGSYTYPLRMGTYYVLIQSNGRKGMNATEVSGKVRAKKIAVGNGQDIDFSCKFDQY